MKLIRPIAITEGMVTSNVTETLSAWSALTTYAAGNLVRRALGGIQHAFESVAGGNINHDPATDDGTYWVDLGATNKFAMFDGSIQSKTSRADDVSVSIAFWPSDLFDHVYLDGLSGTALELTFTDADAVERLSATYSLISNGGIVDFWEWCFEPITRLTSIIITDVPPYPGGTLDASVTAAGETVEVGALVPGLARTLGTTQWGAQVSIVDYSVKQTDDFGNLVIVERAYSKRATFTVNVRADFVDELVTLFASYRATPALYLGDGSYTATAVWGFYRDFSVEIAYPDLSLCSLEVEGLT